MCLKGSSRFMPIVTAVVFTRQVLMLWTGRTANRTDKDWSADRPPYAVGGRPPRLTRFQAPRDEMSLCLTKLMLIEELSTIRSRSTSILLKICSCKSITQPFPELRSFVLPPRPAFKFVCNIFQYASDKGKSRRTFALPSFCIAAQVHFPAFRLPPQRAS